MIQMSDVMLRRILRAPLIEDAPHLMLDLHWVEALLNNVVLMKDVPEEVAWSANIQSRSGGSEIVLVM